MRIVRMMLTLRTRGLSFNPHHSVLNLFNPLNILQFSNKKQRDNLLQQKKDTHMISYFSFVRKFQFKYFFKMRHPWWEIYQRIASLKANQIGGFFEKYITMIQSCWFDWKSYDTCSTTSRKPPNYVAWFRRNVFKDFSISIWICDIWSVR